MFFSQIKFCAIIYLLQTVICESINTLCQEFQYENHYIQIIQNSEYMNISPIINVIPKSIINKSKLPLGLFFSDGRIYGVLKEIVRNYTVTVETTYSDKVCTERLEFNCIFLHLFYSYSLL